MESYKQPTVHDIAEAAGVSIATVSQVLNQRGQRFRPETRERVWRAALAAGYRPNPAARALRSGRLGAVGLVVGERSGSHLPDALLRGLTVGLSQLGGQLVVATVDESAGETLVDLERRLGVDGLLINRHQHFGRALLAQRQATTLPTVWINADLERGCVGPDDVVAGRMATERLLEAGYRDITWIDVLHHGDAPHHSVTDRERGYREAMRAAGCRARRVVATRQRRPDRARQWLAQRHHRAPISAAVGYSFHSAAAMQWVAASLNQPAIPMVVIADEDPGEHAVAVDHVLLPWQAVAERALLMLTQRLTGARSKASLRLPPGA